ncbi:MAG: hypothetical protein ACOCVY_02855 [Patescibacteria group bacterium]
MESALTVEKEQSVVLNKEPKEPCLTRSIRGINYEIKVYWKCSICGTIRGIVGNDKEKIYYRSDMIQFLPGDEQWIPEKICRRCRQNLH